MAKAVKLLQEGLRVKAEPSDVIRTMLQSFAKESSRASSDAQTSAKGQILVAAAPSSTTSADSASIPKSALLGAPMFDAATRVDVSVSTSTAKHVVGEHSVAWPPPPKSPAASESAERSKLCLTPCSGRPPPFPESVPEVSKEMPLASPAPRRFEDGRPSFCSTASPSVGGSTPGKARGILRLGAHGVALGSPMRKIDSDAGGDCDEDEDDDDEEDEQFEDALEEGVPAEVAADEEKTPVLQNTVTLAPLSPIKEVESPGKASSTRASCCSVPFSRPRASRGPADATPKPCKPHLACRSSRPASVLLSPQDSASVNALTPCKDTSFDSARNVLSEPPASAGSRKSKLIDVNGVPYSQIQTIGRGGSSKVYQVLNPAGEVFALKRVSTESPKQLEAFENEVSLLRHLKDHERVIQIVDAEVDRDRGRIYIVMEIGDMDLGTYLRKKQCLGFLEIQTFWSQMLEAVAVIHQERIVHSDLKPGNFLLVRGKLKVIDFGIARQIANDTTNIIRESAVGTLSYMAPEAVKQKMGRSSDIWSLGVILYQMVYGHPPFAHLEPMQRLLKLSDATLTIPFSENHRLSCHSEQTQAQLVEVLDRCLQRDPQRRSTLQELLAHPFLQPRIPEELVRELEVAFHKQKGAFESQIRTLTTQHEMDLSKLKEEAKRREVEREAEHERALQMLRVEAQKREVEREAEHELELQKLRVEAKTRDTKREEKYETSLQTFWEETQMRSSGREEKNEQHLQKAFEQAWRREAVKEDVRRVGGARPQVALSVAPRAAPSNSSQSARIFVSASAANVNAPTSAAAELVVSARAAQAATSMVTSAIASRAALKEIMADLPEAVTAKWNGVRREVHVTPGKENDVLGSSSSIFQQSAPSSQQSSASAACGMKFV
eukprot:TRINITY_DN61711_c0_g1_i1.p1 TRINITY_DN61711_c0_g1~~TRINITY_DN61711_c0_g1_i1.p1  ORF type:complete len:1024 (+),score=171.82 TRINITY_DN61711_c0_g1_i1:399-3074(+)